MSHQVEIAMTGCRAAQRDGGEEKSPARTGKAEAKPAKQHA